MLTEDNLQKTEGGLQSKISPDKSKENWALDELGIRYGNIEDQKQLNHLLHEYLHYPNSQQAELHKQANRLGMRDVQIKNVQKKFDQETFKNSVYCPCCGFVKQQESLKLCQNLDDISNLGLSTFLYFQTIKTLAFVLIEMLLVYAIYALATNAIASGKFTACGKTVSYTSCSSNIDYLSISLGSKQLNQSDQNKMYYYIQAWIGVGMVALWFLTFFALKYFQRNKEIQVDDQTISASDFTLVIENIPQDFQMKQLQNQFTAYEESITTIPKALRRPLLIRKFNKGKPFYLNQSEFKDESLVKLQEQQAQMKKKFTEWIQQRQQLSTFSTTQQQRKQMYAKYSANLASQMTLFQQFGKKIKEKMKEQSSQRTTVAFVTLDTNLAKDMVTTLNPTDYASRFRHFITCGTTSNRLQLKHNGQPIDVKIERAPEPQDVIWSNIGISDFEKLKRKIITFTVTMIMLGLSFLAVYGLSLAQQQNQTNSALSTIISIVITLINIIISQTILRLSIYERDYTTIRYQTSLAVKTIIAQLMNSILVPIFASYFIKNNLYDKNGLADNIFTLGLTNALLPGVLKFFDVGYFIGKFFIWRANKPDNKLSSNQIELNATVASVEFQIGYQYNYLVYLFLFTCYFVSLQPIIVVFTIVGFFIMFWSQKWALFNRMKRPIPGNELMNDAMSKIIFLGPVVYSLGSLTWSNFFPGGIPASALLPNLIAMGISVFILIFPLSIIFPICMNIAPDPELKYDDNRIYLSSQHDRLNPATAKTAFDDFSQYVKSFEAKMKNASNEEKQKMAAKINHNAQRGLQQQNHNPTPFPMGMNMLFAAQPMRQPMFGQILPGMPGMMPSPMMSFMPQPQQRPMFAPQQMMVGPTFIPQPQPQPFFQNNMQRQPQGQPMVNGFPQQPLNGFGMQPNNGGFVPNNGGFPPNNGGFNQNNGGFNQYNGGFQQPNRGPINPFGNFGL